MGDENISLPFGKRDKIYVFKILSCDISLDWSADHKNNDTYSRAHERLLTLGATNRVRAHAEYCHISLSYGSHLTDALVRLNKLLLLSLIILFA